MIVAIATVLVTNWHAGERLNKQLGQERELERQRLLYDRRADLYDLVAEQTAKLATLFSRARLTFLLPHPGDEEFEDRISSSMGEFAHQREELRILQQRASYLATLNFVRQLKYYCDSVDRLLNAIANTNKGQQIDNYEGHYDSLKYFRLELTNVMRKDLGSTERLTRKKPVLNEDGDLEFIEVEE